jgi:hypothetical protein
MSRSWTAGCLGSWPTVQRVVIAYVRRALGEPQPTAVLGLDEARFGHPRWMRGPGGWIRTDPWETGFVDLAGGQGYWGRSTGVAPPPSAAGWLNAVPSSGTRYGWW